MSSPRFDRSAAIDVFGGYVRGFDLRNPQIALKYEHTLNVAELCAEVARGVGMGSGDVDLAWLCGLLHDIGRFEQLRTWGTFRDSKSVSHAKLGLAVLEGGELPDAGLRSRSGMLLEFTDEPGWASVIRRAVGLHSDLRLPDGLDSRTRLFCEILRDADKIDILRVFSRSECEAVLGLTPGEFACGGISDAAMAGFREHRCLGPVDRKEALDGLVGVVCLAFELTSNSAAEALGRRGYLEELVARPFGLSPRFCCPDTQIKWDEIARAVV